MANQEHLDILAKGVEAWNQWRAQDAHLRPDLRDADLTASRLDGGANLWKALLRNAILKNADLHTANLFRAELTGADLDGANLNDADLSFGKFNGAKLRG